MSTTFKVGDRINRIGRSRSGVVQGQDYIVRTLSNSGQVYLEGMGESGYTANLFELVEPAKDLPVTKVTPLRVSFDVDEEEALKVLSDFYSAKRGLSISLDSISVWKDTASLSGTVNPA